MKRPAGGLYALLLLGCAMSPTPTVRFCKTFSTMKQRYAFALTVLIFSCLVSSAFGQTTYTFSTAGNWNVGTNWTGGAVPPDPLPVGDSIVINANCTRSWYTTINGTMTVNAGKILTIFHSSEPLTFTNGGVTNNHGTIDCKEEWFVNQSGKTTTNFSGATFSTTSVSGTLSNSGTFTNNSGATVTTVAFSGVANENGGLFTNNGTITHVGAWQNKSGSTLDNNATLNGTNSAGSIINQAGGTLNLNNGSTLTAFCTFTNSGTLNLNSGGILVLNKTPAVWPGGTFNWNTSSTVKLGAELNLESGITLTVESGRTLEVIAPGYVRVKTGATLVVNGTQIHTGGAASLIIRAGATLVVNGTLNTNTALVTMLGTLKGNGTVVKAPDFGVGSVLAPGSSPGTLTATSASSLFDATYQCEINGTGAGQFDKYASGGTVFLSNTQTTLTVTLGYTPVVGDAFVIITGTSRVGTFMTTNLPSLPAGLAWAVQYNTNNVTLSVTTAAPVELTQFKAHIEGAATHLDWTTATETNNKGFSIERSPDGVHWKTLDFMDGKGNSHEEVFYSFIDEQPLFGLNYYRLLQVDFDGHETRSPMVHVARKGQPGQVLVYPNPVVAGTDCLVASDFGEGNEARSMRLWDAAGRQVATFLNAQHLNTADLKPGIYWLEVQSDQGYSVEKVVVR